MVLPSFKWFVKEDMFIAKASPQEHEFAAGDVDSIAIASMVFANILRNLGSSNTVVQPWLLRIPPKKNDELAGN